MSGLIDIAYTRAEMREEASEAKNPDVPQYPYGLCINLEGDTLDKLGITELPAIGQLITISAVAKVVSLSLSQSQSETDDDDRRNVSLQITRMKISDEQDAPAPKNSKSGGSNGAKSILGYYNGGTGNG